MHESAGRVCGRLGSVNFRSGVGMLFCFFFQAEDGIRDLVRSRGLGDVYKRQVNNEASESLIVNRESGEVRLLSEAAARSMRVALPLSLIHI